MLKGMRKKIRTIWNNRNKILEGVKNSICPTMNVERVAKIRDEVCQKCEHIDREGKSCIAPGTQPCCSLCGCCLSIKQRSLSSACDDHRWNAVLTQEEEDTLNQLNDGSNLQR